MAEIRNDEGFVTSTTLTGLGKMTALKLSSVEESAAIGVKAESECSRTYEKGKQITTVIKGFLTETYQCMNETSLFLQTTDEQSVKSTTNATSWSLKIGIK